MKEKEITQISQIDSEEDFVVSITSPLDDDTTLVTGFDIEDKIQAAIQEKLLSAFNEYDPSNKRYSAFLNESAVDVSGLTLARLAELARNPQSDLKSIQEINSFIRYFINSDDLIGCTYDAVKANLNTEVRLSYNQKAVEGKKQKANALEKAKVFINELNQQINLTNIIRQYIPLVYAEGNCVLYLRSVGENFVVDHYPLAVAIVSDYSVNGESVILIDIKELTNRLKKTQLKDKKGKSLFFKDVEEEISKNYPPEVLTAYKNKESYAVLESSRARIIRTNSLGRRYGLSPLFRALKPTLMLDNFANADSANSKAMAKKVIFQKMRKENMGSNFDRKAWEDTSYAHKSLVDAWKQNTVLYTGTPGVEGVEYIEPSTSMVDSDTVRDYRTRAMITLGVSFLNTEHSQSVGQAKISISQLLLNINSISEDFERVLYDWYQLALSEHNLDPSLAPHIEIIDSEMLETNLKLEMAKLLYTTFNVSRETSLGLLGISLSDEKFKREQENVAELDKVFAAYPTSYTRSGDDESGRPQNTEDNEGDKQSYDETYNQDERQ